MYHTATPTMAEIIRASPTNVGTMTQEREMSQLSPTKSPSQDEHVPSPPWPVGQRRGNSVTSQLRRLTQSLTIIAHSVHTRTPSCTAVPKVPTLTGADLRTSTVTVLSITAVLRRHQQYSKSSTTSGPVITASDRGLTMCRLAYHSHPLSSHFDTDIRLACMKKVFSPCI